nr:hypothetical protein [Tanacetum cinerariifolium]
MAPKKTPMSVAAIKALIAQGVTDVLADYEENKGSGNGHDNYDSGSGGRRPVPTAQLTQWFEKMESVLHISSCTVENQVKYATCTILRNALTWWNYHVKNIGHDDIYGMPWKTLMKMMTDKMFPEEFDEVKKYVGGLPDMIQGNMMSGRPKTMQEAIYLANDMMDQKVKDNKEKDKIRAKPDKIKSKRKAWESPDSSPTKSKPSQS